MNYAMKMNCFNSSQAEVGENDSKDKKTVLSQVSLPEGGKSDSNTSSLPMSEPSPDSPRPTLSPSASKRPQNLRVFSYTELRAATKNFSHGNLLGEGGFGFVYKGWIVHSKPNEGETKIEIAVKQLKRNGQQGHKEWLTEVHFLGLVEHPNLVQLLGYCAEDDERGIQRLLVYEFMPNRSLEDHMFRRNFPVLPWNVRMNVALGAACGLAYLHEEIHDLQVIFRDFKTSNVLLDQEYNPKLSDFGLARQGPETGVSHVSTAVVGTVGYAAPEYIQTGHLTSKSDVWSFGVVLLEMLSGRRSMDRNRPKSEQRLVEWVRPYILDSKKIRHVMDPRLENQYSLEQAVKLASLAQQCLAKHPRSRPKMSDVVDKLQQIIDICKGEHPTEFIKSPSSIRSEPVEIFSKESRKKSNSVKRKFPLFGEVISSKNTEERSTWRTWVPKLVRA